MPIDNEIKKMDPLSIEEELTATLCRESGLNKKEARGILNLASIDKRYINYCNTKTTAPERHKFKLILATMIIQENRLKDFQLGHELSDLELKTLTAIAIVNEEYLDFCKGNPNPVDRKEYEVSLIKKIFADNPNILHSFCISSPSRRLSPSRKL